MHSTTSDDSLQGRPRGGEATEWHSREPQAPEGKGTATLKFCTGDYCTKVATHAPEDCLEGKSLGFSMKRRESCGSPEL